MKPLRVSPLWVCFLLAAGTALGSGNTTLTFKPATVLATPPSSNGSRLKYAPVTIDNGLNTEIAISNPSAESGSCELRFFGSGPASGSSETTPVIPAGGDFRMVLSQWAGTQGYAIADCTFPMARGSVTVLRVSPASANPTSTSLSSSLNPARYGQQVTLTATVTPPAATGRVAFYDGTTLLGTDPVMGGSATLMTPLLSAGVRSLKALYLGDVNDASSASPVLPQSVTPGAGFGFLTTANYTAAAGVDPKGIAAGDFNGDGKVDLVVANYGSNNVSVLLGNGDGTFQQPTTYVVGSNPQAVVVADFNGDGQADLAVANFGSGNVSILLGRGDGTFGAATNVSKGTGPQALAAGDLNGDGIADLVVANNSGQTVSVLLGNGDGTFRAATSLNYGGNFGGGPYSVALTDFNGDGKLDLAVGAVTFGPCPDCTSYYVSINLGNGDGSFQTGQTLFTNGAAIALAVGDFNRDGNMDLAVADSSEVGVYLGNGDGTLRQEVAINPASWLGSNTFIVAGDFNGDGLTDLVAGGKQVAAFLSKGDGTFQIEPINYSTGSSPFGAVAADFTRDGIADLALVNSGSNNVSVLLGAPGPPPALYIDTPASGATFQGPTITIAGWAIDNLTSVGNLQITVDGTAAGNATYGISRPDVCAVYPGRPNCPNVGYTFLLNTAGLAAGPHVIGVSATDNDILPQTTTATVTIRLNGVTPSSVSLASSLDPAPYGQVVTLTASLTPSTATGTVAFYDGASLIETEPVVMGAAKLSTALINPGAHSFKAYYGGDLNTMPGTSPVLIQAIVVPRDGSGFQSRVSYSVGSTPFALATGDFNGDGRIDLAVVNNAGNNVSILLGKGDGTFQPAVNYATGTTPYAIVTGDFNGDGKLDLAVANRASANVSVLLGNGDGTFRPPVNYAAGNLPQGVAAGDLNGDGYLDLVVANFSDSTVSVFLGIGNGTFLPAVNYNVVALFGGPTSVTLADLNGDGKPDLAIGVNAQDFPCSACSPHALNVRFGNGDGTFQAEQSYYGDNAATTLVAADFNGDGLIDIATANTAPTGFGSGAAAIFRNGGAAGFAATTLVAGASSTDRNAIALGDFNGDGKPDLALVGDQVGLLLGNGDGTFSFQTMAYGGNTPSSVVTGDFNGDGLTDLAISNAGDNTVSILLGVAASAPRIVIDSPAPGAPLTQGTLVVAGWALDDSTAIASVQVKVDGVVAGTAMYGISRPDVCAVYSGRPGCPNVGYSFSLNTSGLSSGIHTISVTATDSDVSPDSTTASVTITVSNVLPTVNIDSPMAGSVLSGTVLITGWALDNAAGIGTSLSSVVVKVDGVVVGNASYGVSRPDICALYPGRLGCPNVGFVFALNTSLLTAGPHIITVAATDRDANPDTGSSSVTISVASAPPSVYIDTPGPGMVLSGIANVAGWAVDSGVSVGTPIASVVVKVDGNVVGNATYGTSRPDVCAAYPNRPNCPNVGFTYTLDTTRLSVGMHMLTVVATDSDGIPDSGSWSVAFQVVTAQLLVFIDSPAANAPVMGTITVGGWAIDNPGTGATAIGSVKVLVDGSFAGTATYGVNRPDVCAAYPGRPGCPNVGFNFQLNTLNLTAGAHTLTVVATDTDQNPDTGSSSVIFQVNNPPPSVYIDTPAANALVTGTITIGGWAIDNTSASGTAIGSVTVQVDGNLVGTATYGVNRPDVCAAYPGRPGCPNVGFTFTLNTLGLTAGTHTLTVVAMDTDQNPDMGSNSVPFRVLATP